MLSFACEYGLRNLVVCLSVSDATVNASSHVRNIVVVYVTASVTVCVCVPTASPHIVPRVWPLLTRLNMYTVPVLSCECVSLRVSVCLGALACAWAWL